MVIMETDNGPHHQLSTKDFEKELTIINRLIINKYENNK
jgi:hypothetical protein